MKSGDSASKSDLQHGALQAELQTWLHRGLAVALPRAQNNDSTIKIGALGLRSPCAAKDNRPKAKNP